MNPHAERLIALATRPLDYDAKLQLPAATKLRWLIETSPASADDISEAAETLAGTYRRPRRHGWRRMLYLTTLLVSLPALALPLWQLHKLTGLTRLLSPGAKASPLAMDPTAGLTLQQKLLLSGDAGAATRSGRWKPLWESDPENPAYLLEYSRNHHLEHEGLTPEIREAAARVDPDNAWFALMDAAAMAGDALKKESPSADERQKGAKPTLTVVDEAKFKKALDLFHEAARKPRVSSGDPELMKQRILLLPSRGDIADHYSRTAYLAAQTEGTVALRHLANAVSAQAGRCAARNDSAGFKLLVDDWKWLIAATARDGNSLVDLLVAKAFFTMPLSDLRDAAEVLGLKDEARELALLNEQHEARQARSRLPEHDRANSDLIESKGSFTAALTLTAVSRQVEAPPPLTEAALRPWRLAEHAMFGRAHALASWLILGLLVTLAGVSRNVGNGIARVLSRRFQDLFRASDWAWILLGGIVVPLVWGAVIIRLTPLSTMDWSVMPPRFLMSGGQLAAVTLLMLVSSSFITARRLDKRLSFLGPRPRLLWLGRLSIMATALAVPLIGSAMIFPGGTGHSLFLAGWILNGVALSWLVWGLIRHAFDRPRSGSLRRTTLARLIVPAWSFGMLLFAALGLAHYAEERHWIGQDRLLEIAPESPALSRYEWDVTQVLRKELLEMTE